MLRYNLCMILWVTISGVIHLTGACSEHAMQKALFEDYNKKVRPVKDRTTKTVLQVHTKIDSIISVNEQDESIDLVVWMALTWHDEFLRWNAIDFDNCSSIFTLASEIWLPDYVIVNILDSVPLVSSDILYVYIQSNGSVLLWQGSHLTLRCPMDITAFPFDTQTCKIRGSIWSYDSKQIYLTLADQESAMTDIQTESAEFETLSFEGKEVPYIEAYTNGTYSELQYNLKLRRRPEYYIYVLVVPSFLLTSLCIIGIFTPNSNTGDRNEKMTLGLTTLLSMAVILNITADAMPKSAKGLPLLGYYVLYEIGMCSLATILSTAIIFIHERATTRDWDPPPLISWIATLKTPWEYFKRAKTTFEMEKNSAPFHRQNQLKGNQQKRFKGNSSGMIASLNSTIYNHETMADLRHIMSKIDDHLEMLKSDAENRKIWIIALDRIDLTFLVLLLISNFLLTAVLLF